MARSTASLLRGGGRQYFTDRLAQKVLTSAGGRVKYEGCEIVNTETERHGKLDGKVAVVTGAGSGMGRASALLFAAEGAKVVCADLSGHEESAAAEIGAGAIAVRADVSQAADVQAMFAAAVETFGRLDVVFNNAGFNAPHHPLDESDDDLFDRLVAVNLRGVFLGIKYAIPALRASGAVRSSAPRPPPAWSAARGSPPTAAPRAAWSR